MKPNLLRVLGALVACFLGCGLSVQASSSSLTISNLSYVNWSSAVFGQRGSATGLIISNLVGQIGVEYRGEVAPASQIGGRAGIDYWNPGKAFLSTVISNLPPVRDVIALASDDTLNTLLFSEPVVDPVLLILSLGQNGVPVRYDFDAPFTILSQGPGYWGNGLLIASEPDVLLGEEGHGAIQFKGVYSSLSWRVTGAEDWHGFTVGIPVDPSAGASVSDSPILMAAALGFAACLCRWCPR